VGGQLVGSPLPLCPDEEIAAADGVAGVDSVAYSAYADGAELGSRDA
jgi:hypothetical protein